MSSLSKTTKYAFWTSGWDSTYMIIQLLRQGDIVQPIYVDNPRRKSRKFELAALAKLSQLISERIPSGKLLPVRVVPLRSINIDPEIVQAFQSLMAQIPDGQRPLGYQYRYLASFIKQNQAETPSVAIGIEHAARPEECACSAIIQQFGQLDHSGRIDQAKSNPDLVTLLGGFEFPIINISEPEMRKNIQKWGYEDIMQHIWFCHRPIRGRQCGMCNPCSSKIASGMNFLLPEASHARHQCFSQIRQKHGSTIGKLYEVSRHIRGK